MQASCWRRHPQTVSFCFFLPVPGGKIVVLVFTSTSASLFVFPSGTSPCKVKFFTLIFLACPPSGHHPRVVFSFLLNFQREHLCLSLLLSLSHGGPLHLRKSCIGDFLCSCRQPFLSLHLSYQHPAFHVDRHLVAPCPSLSALSALSAPSPLVACTSSHLPGALSHHHVQVQRLEHEIDASISP